MSSDAAQAPTQPQEATARALLSGVVVGLLICIGNLFLGLKTGFWDSGQVTASVLAFVVAKGLPSRRGRFTPLENNAAQVTAASAGAMPAAAGLIGALPALTMLGGTASPWAILGLGVSLGVLGVLLALALRQRLIVDERLPFPTGVATAGVISALHGEAREGLSSAWALFSAALGAGGIAFLRDARGLLPQLFALPGSLGGVPCAAFTLGLTFSPLLLGVGVVVGLRTAASLALGSLISWAGLAPRALALGFVAKPEFEPLTGWLLWPGVALLLGAALVSLLRQAKDLPAAARDLLALGSNPHAKTDRAGALLAAAAIAAALLAGALGFGLPPLQTALALALFALLGTACGRAAGQTDISPVGQMGQLTQVVFGASTHGAASLNVAAGQVVAGGAAQTGVTLWSLKAGELLGARLRPQAAAALLGTVAGALFAIPLYVLLVRTQGLGSAQLPAPSAQQWRALAAVAAHGAAALPKGASSAVIWAAVAGALLELLQTTRAGRVLPSPVALAIGFLVPAHYGAAILLGAVLFAVWSRARPAAAERLGPALGAGAIAGESVMGVVVAALTAFSVLTPP